MRWFVRLTVVFVVLPPLIGCRQGSSSVDEWSGVVAPQVLESARLRYYWRFKVDLDKGETIREIRRLDENLYALTSANRLIAIDAARGLYKWSYPLGDRVHKVFAPCHANDVQVPKIPSIAELVNPNPQNLLKPFNAVVINTLSYALLINRDTGKLVRRLDFNFAANTPGCCDGVHFYVASVKGHYHAVRLSEGICQWTMSTGDVITARPQIFDRRLYVAGQDGKFRSVHPLMGSERQMWSQLTDGALSADFVVDGRGCFVPSQDYRLYAYDSLTGVELWKFVTQGPLRQASQAGSQTVFQFAHKDRFYAINLANGRKRWDLPDGRTVLATVQIDKRPYVLVLTAGRELLLVDEMLGQVDKSLPMTGLDLFIPNADKPVVYAAATDGKIVCIRPASAGHLTPEMLKD